MASVLHRHGEGNRSPRITVRLFLFGPSTTPGVSAGQGPGAQRPQILKTVRTLFQPADGDWGTAASWPNPNRRTHQYGPLAHA